MRTPLSVLGVLSFSLCLRGFVLVLVFCFLFFCVFFWRVCMVVIPIINSELCLAMPEEEGLELA